jgi:hypothetical protein
MRHIDMIWDDGSRPPWQIDWPPTALTNPFDDLQTWVGAATERQYLAAILGDRDTSWRFPRELAIERLQYRRDSQAGGRPLWTTPKLIPEDIRNRSWHVFACRATDTHLYPIDNLDMLRRRLAVRDHALQDSHR